MVAAADGSTCSWQWANLPVNLLTNYTKKVALVQLTITVRALAISERKAIKNDFKPIRSNIILALQTR